MILVAVLPDGEALKKELIIDDPRPAEIRLNPKESVSGEINLETLFRDLRRALKVSDVHLFWAYEAPKELGIARWSGGWVLIPKRH